MKLHVWQGPRSSSSKPPSFGTSKTFFIGPFFGTKKKRFPKKKERGENLKKKSAPKNFRKATTWDQGFDRYFCAIFHGPFVPQRHETLQKKRGFTKLRRRCVPTHVDTATCKQNCSSNVQDVITCSFFKKYGQVTPSQMIQSQASICR